MRRRAFVAVVACAAFAALAAMSACTFGLDGFADGPADAVGGASGDGASVDASAADAAAEAAPPSPCASPHLFCADFDESSDPKSGWDDSDQDHGKLEIDTSLSVSPPQSFKAFIMHPGAGEHDTDLVENITVSNDKMHFEADVRVEEPQSSWSGQMNIIEVFMMPPPAGLSSHLVSLILGHDDTIVQYFEDDPAGNGANNSTHVDVPTGRWFHATIDLAYGASPLATFTIDGSTVSVAMGGGGFTTANLAIGAAYTDGVDDGRTLHFDNVVVDSP